MEGTAKRYWTTDEVEERVKQKEQDLKSRIMEEIKTEWIKQFGSLNDEHERNGYFVTGFVRSILEHTK